MMKNKIFVLYFMIGLLSCLYSDRKNMESTTPNCKEQKTVTEAHNIGTGQTNYNNIPVIDYNTIAHTIIQLYYGLSATNNDIPMIYYGNDQYINLQTGQVIYNIIPVIDYSTIVHNIIQLYYNLSAVNNNIPMIYYENGQYQYIILKKKHSMNCETRIIYELSKSKNYDLNKFKTNLSDFKTFDFTMKQKLHLNGRNLQLNNKELQLNDQKLQLKDKKSRFNALRDLNPIICNYILDWSKSKKEFLDQNEGINNCIYFNRKRIAKLMPNKTGKAFDDVYKSILLYDLPVQKMGIYKKQKNKHVRNFYMLIFSILLSLYAIHACRGRRYDRRNRKRISAMDIKEFKNIQKPSKEFSKLIKMEPNSYLPKINVIKLKTSEIKLLKRNKFISDITAERGINFKKRLYYLRKLSVKNIKIADNGYISKSRQKSSRLKPPIQK